MGSGGRGISVVDRRLIMVVACFLFLVEASSAAYVVGSNSGWTVPPTSNPNLYSDWSSKLNLAIGDSIEFIFQGGNHTVVEVPKSGYDDCSTQNMIGAIISTTPFEVNFTSIGDHYYICSIPGHCLGGQKVAITVAASHTTTIPTATGGGSNSAAPSLPSGFRSTAAGFSLVLVVAALLSIAS